MVDAMVEKVESENTDGLVQRVRMDAERLKKDFDDVGRPEDLSERLLSVTNINEPEKVYVRSVELNDDGAHATAVCIKPKSENSIVIITPQWHFFDNDWWQTDD